MSAWVWDDDTEEEECNHEGHVVKGRCERCGQDGLETDYEIYEKENPR